MAKKAKIGEDIETGRCLCENIKAREKVPADEQLTCYHKEPERAGGRVAEASKMYSEEAEHSTVLLSMPLTMLRQPSSPARMQPRMTAGIDGAQYM